MRSEKMFEHEPEQLEPLLVTEVLDPFESDPYVATELTRIVANGIAVIPNNYPDETTPIFAPETIDLLQYVSATSDINIEAIRMPGEPGEMRQYNDALRIAALVIEYALLPLIIGLLSNFISEHLGYKKDTSGVKCKIFVRIGKKTFKLNYQGPAKEFRSLMELAAKNMKEENGEP